MKYIYLKKDGKFLHIAQIEHEEYQDSSDISAMYTQQYILKNEKEGAVRFLEQRECDRFLSTKGKRLKGFTEVKE